MNSRELRPLAIYVHIPFCEQKCRYCDFLSAQATDETKYKYVNALLHEIMHTDGSHHIVTSVYIGGGTPSCVQSFYIVKIMTALRRRFRFAENAEITMEVNPGTVRKSSLADYRAAGVNRLSVGLQSTFDDELRKLGRIHDYKIFLNTYGIIRAAGFDNVNIDLMSSLPKQTVEKMQISLERVVGLHPEHISVYSLIIEDGTPFKKAADAGELDLPDEDTEIEIDLMTRKYLADHGYRRYEISNYSKPGFECRHNIVYWDRKEYLGFGIGAASLMGHTRFANTRHLKQYIASNGMAGVKTQNLSEKDEMEEFMFMGLRKIDGVSEKDFKEFFGKELKDVYGEILVRQEAEGMIEHLKDRWALTERGLDVSNTLMAEYLF